MPEKLLIVGRGSPRDKNVFEEKFPELNGLTIDDYCHKLGVKVFHDADNNGAPLTVSCHKTDELLDEHSSFIKSIALNSSPVAVFYGGMSLQLPSQVSAKVKVMPVIGVPMDSSYFEGVSAELSLFDLPPGCATGWVGRGQIGKALYFATCIHALPTEPVIHYVGANSWRETSKKDDMDKNLATFGLKTTTPYLKLTTIALSEGPLRYIPFDEAAKTEGEVYIHVLPQKAGESGLTEVKHIGELVAAAKDFNGFIIEGANNAAIFVAQIVGLQSPETRDLIHKFYEGIKNGTPGDPKTKYTQRMSYENFR